MKQMPNGVILNGAQRSEESRQCTPVACRHHPLDSSIRPE